MSRNGARMGARKRLRTHRRDLRRRVMEKSVDMPLSDNADRLLLRDDSESRMKTGETFADLFQNLSYLFSQ